LTRTFTFIDLFAGVGGTRLGFEAAGAECVFTSEWDEAARKTYGANHEISHPFEGDIRGVAANLVPDHDVLVAGFPCQPFSLAGVSKKTSMGRPHGFLDETQGTLFFEIARVLAEKQPGAFLLENVRNLRSHDGGRTIETIESTLVDLGYSVHIGLVSSESFVPQKRERILIAGFRSATDFDWNDLNLGSQRPLLSEILHPGDGSEMEESPYTVGPDARVSDRYTLTPNLWAYLHEYKERHRAKGNGFGYGLVGPNDQARTLSARYYKDGAEILIRQESEQPRRLTPREAARLMGFPNSFRLPASDKDAYKQMGNSVVVPLISAAARLVLNQLRREPRLKPVVPGRLSA
jgi:DNA (cytosine-5)-methyltransferase 1